MRTTVILAPDVAAAVKRLSADKGLGVSDVINGLIRAGLAAQPYRSRTFDARPRVDLANTSEVLEVLEGPDHR